MSSGTSPVSSYVKLDNTTSSATSYKSGIDGNSVAALRIAANFAPYGSTAMLVNLMPGHVLNGVTLTEVAAQVSSTIVAPVSNSRIDRLVITRSSGGLVVVAGTAGVSPSAPAIPSSCVPVAQVLIASSATALGNSVVTDERDLGQLGAAVSQLLNYAVDTGSANAYAIAPSPAITAYAAGHTVFLTPTNNQTAACTIAVNGLSAKNIKTVAGTDPASGYMTTTGTYMLVYDGTNFILQNPKTNIAANTVLLNTSSAAGFPLGMALSTGTLLARASSNIVALSLDTTLLITASSTLGVNVGTASGQIVQLTSAGLPAVSGANLTGISQGITLLSNQTASSVASLNFGSSLITSAYDWYEFVLKDVATVSSLAVNFGITASSDNGTTTTGFPAGLVENISGSVAAATTAGSSTGNNIRVAFHSTAIAAARTYNGKITVINPLAAGSSLVSNSPVFGQFISNIGITTPISYRFTGTLNINQANYIKFGFSSANIATGSIALYGYKNT